MVKGLGRLIALTTVAATLAGIAIAVSCIYLFYAVIFDIAPDVMSESETWFPSGPEWLVIIAASIAGTGLATYAAVRLARRIVTPLQAVAVSARKIANGDLSARVEDGDRSLGEAALLIDDFNLMAANLEKASAGVSHWNALIAHELRTPVTILSGRLQGLVDGVFAPDPELLRSLQAQAQGLARLVEDLRTVSLFDSGHLDLVFETVDLADELQAVIHLMEPGLKERGFSLDVSLQAGLCQIDPARLRQVLVALLENARRHATPGVLRVALDLTLMDGEITVADRGPGIPSEFVEHAFTPFRRSAPPDTPRRGSGLGLAVVRAIAQAHGGEASYAHVDGGACFRVRFRRHASTLEVAPATP